MKIGLPSLTFARSESPSDSAGTSSAANFFGAPTELDGSRVPDQVTGQLGQGDSEIETESSPEGAQQAARTYRKVYAKYRKLSEAVMIEEAVPLGHRQIIKRYFELIHPARIKSAEQLRDVLEDATTEETSQ